MKRKLLGVSLVVAAVAIALSFAWSGTWSCARGGPSSAVSPRDRAARTEAAAVVSRGLPRHGGAAWAADGHGSLRIEGQVVGPDGVGVAGASVAVTAAPRRIAVAEADGSFTFERLVGRTYAITATAGDMIGGPVTVRPTPDSEPVVVRLGRGASLAVRVIDDASKPIAGAAVELVDATARAATTDADGKATLGPLHPGAVAVTVSAAGYAVTGGIATIGPAGTTESLTITLRVGHAASGRVIDERGQPIAGVEVSVADAIGGAGTGARAQTDAAGQFTIHGLGAGTHTLIATDGSHAPVTSAPIAITDRSIAGLEIAMTAGGVVAGVVVAADASPVAHAIVRVTGRGGRGPTVARELTCDDQGRFEARGLPRAAVHVQAESHRAASDTVDIDLTTAQAAREVKLVLDATGTIAGVVVDPQGSPMPEIQVTAYRDGNGEADGGGRVASPSSATSDGSGAFVLHGLRAGAYRLFAASRHTGARNPERGTPAAVGARDVRIALVAPGSLRGELQLAGTREAPARAHVQLGHQTPVPVVAGHVEIADAAPGRHDVTFRGEFADVVLRDVSIEAGKVTDLGTITVSRGRTLAGRVVDERGAPVADAQVRLGEPGGFAATEPARFGDARPGRSAVSGRDGAFTLTGVPSGAANVAAYHHRGRSSAQTLPPGDADPAPVTLVLRRHGSVAGTLTMQGRPQGDATITIASRDGATQPLRARTGDDGAFAFAEVPEGQHVISAVVSGTASLRSTSLAVAVAAGAQTTVALELPRGAISLSIRIGAPAGVDAQVFLFRGEVSATTLAQLGDAAAQGSLFGMAPWLARSPRPAVFDDLVPGVYTVCAVGSDGGGATAEAQPQEAANTRPHCKQVDIPASPARQSLVHELPATSPGPRG